MRLRKVDEALREYHLCIHYGPGTIIAEQSETAIGAYEQHAMPFDREKAEQARRELRCGKRRKNVCRRQREFTDKRSCMQALERLTLRVNETLS